MNARHFHALRRPIAALVLVAQCASPLMAMAAVAPEPKPAATKPAAPARATSATAKKLPVVVARALGLYQQDRYDEAVSLLVGPVSRGELQGADLREARIVLARCYVKKGLTNRANENFSAILAVEPAFVLDATKADAEEIAAFQALRPAPPASGPAATTTPATPNPTAPREKTPAMKAALPKESGVTKKGWLSSHKAVAALLAVAAGGAVAVAAGGGGGTATPIPPTPTVPDFPPPPTP